MTHVAQTERDFGRSPDMNFVGIQKKYSWVKRSYQHLAPSVVRPHTGRVKINPTFPEISNYNFICTNLMNLYFFGLSCNTF